MCFHTAASGEVRWKECLSTEEGRIGSKNTLEAFALLLLMNNHKARLCEEKKTHQTNLLTEHDSPPSCGKPSIVGKVLDGVQFNLDLEASPTVITDKTDPICMRLEKERSDCVGGILQIGSLPGNKPWCPQESFNRGD
jgi:hypothetical protein